MAHVCSQIQPLRVRAVDTKRMRLLHRLCLLFQQFRSCPAAPCPWLNVGEAGFTAVPGSPTGGVGTAVSVAVVPVGVSAVTEPLGASPVADVPAAELVCGDVTDPGAPACCVRRKPFPSLAARCTRSA